MPKVITEAWLLNHGVDRATLDAALAAAPKPAATRKARAAAEAAPELLAPGAPGRWEVEIAGWRPAFASELKCHPMRAARLKKRDAREVLAACLAAGVTRPAGRRRVALLIVNRYGGFPDPDAPLKSGLDALKTAGAIRDDSARWCEWDKPAFGRGPLKTVITLEDLPESG